MVTILLLLAGIGFSLRDKEKPNNITLNKSLESPVKDQKEAQRSLFQPLLPEAPIASENNNNSTVSSIAGIEQAPAEFEPSAILTGLKPDTRLLQGSQKKQRNTQFTKIDFDGNVLPDTASRWSCARDTRTSLLWETKLFDAGISDTDHRYSWHDPTRRSQGVKNQGDCFGIPCDSHAYKQEMNRIRLCGSAQWRLPDFAELESLLDRNYFNPVINQEIFFNTRGTSYWTQSQLENSPELVMQIDFFNGTSSPAPVHFKLAIRLVSGQGAK